jgi:hypothetical protein
MRNKAILFSLILVASSAVLAEQNSLEAQTKQAVKGKVTEVTPNAVEKVEATNQTLDKAKTLKEGAEIAPDTLQDQPKEAEKSIETLKTGKETTENLKGKAGDVAKSTKSIKSKAKVKAAEKALELPH